MTQSLPSDICFLCLNRERKIFQLPQKCKNLFGFLTDWYPLTDARVCWECRATLERLRRFKEQAERAVCALERARTGLQPMNFECLSTVYGTQMHFIDLLVYDDANASDNFTVDTSKDTILCREYKVEVEFEDNNPRIKEEIEELDFGANANYENAPDRISEHDEVGTECFVTIDWREDNTEYAMQHDTEIKFPLTQLQIDAPSSSAEVEITSKNAENASEIKKSEGVVKTKVKRKKPTVRRIRRNLSTAEKLIKKERREEQHKYELYQQGKAFECDHCGKKFEMRRKITKHIMRVHHRNVTCDQCVYKCYDQSGLRKHMLTHLEPSQRPLRCEVCLKRFTTKHNLLVHTRRHTGGPFKCDACDKAFVCEEDFLCHIRERHVSRETNPQHNTKYTIIKHSEHITYECNFCKEIFASLITFRKHYYSAHKDSEVHPCAECNKTFKRRSQLTEHVKFVHRGVRPHLCNICGVGCTTKRYLKQHMSSHSNEKPFKCNECSATFKYKSGLWGHKMIHKGEKPHQCDICEARFTQKYNLVGHMKVHSKDRPFKCDICSKKFPWKRNLKSHLKTHSKKQQLISLL